MEFKKKKKNPNHAVDISEALVICIKKYTNGVTINNGKVLGREQKDVILYNIVDILKGDDDASIKVKFKLSETNNSVYTYTLWHKGVFADIIT